MKVLQKNVICLFVMICFCCVPFTAWASSTKDVKKTADAATEKTKKTAKKTVKNAVPLDLNTATVAELKTLNGIGDKKAQAIVDYRKKKGPFKTPEDIMNVKGIGKSLYKKNKSMLSVSSQLSAPKTKTKKK